MKPLITKVVLLLEEQIRQPIDHICSSAASSQAQARQPIVVFREEEFAVRRQRFDHIDVSLDSGKMKAGVSSVAFQKE